MVGRSLPSLCSLLQTTQPRNEGSWMLRYKFLLCYRACLRRVSDGSLWWCLSFQTVFIRRGARCGRVRFWVHFCGLISLLMWRARSCWSSGADVEWLGLWLLDLPKGFFSLTTSPSCSRTCRSFALSCCPWFTGRPLSLLTPPMCIPPIATPTTSLFEERCGPN